MVLSFLRQRAGETGGIVEGCLPCGSASTRLLYSDQAPTFRLPFDKGSLLLTIMFIPKPQVSSQSSRLMHLSTHSIFYLISGLNVKPNMNKINLLI